MIGATECFRPATVEAGTAVARRFELAFSCVGLALGLRRLGSSLSPRNNAKIILATVCFLSLVPHTTGQVHMTASDGELCPPWCLDRAVRSWSCETLDCQPCREACLAVKPYERAVFASLPAERAAVMSHQESWTCPPTWPPRHLYVLFTLPRSASTTTCSVVNTLPDAYCADELLSQHRHGPEDDNALLRTDPALFLQQHFEAAFSANRAAPYAAVSAPKHRSLA